ncbi:hypothetical protein P152DRAFT_480184 [Eremomyces bilateralis CBS 781.70]|uniref:YMC020W-like alpha/beta hydrolase domain-containing protein n=1 Tax=Eremomyces bilateralis CBS 781.70 TaxID=1392243 RepID=A0A6G1GB16_9PEZI|nr:uncharacterized protein P152DRAFT_480184 [Eremomyces bilateralis CBS 781.70]KAF1815100.1 hypothetical protein P152DRAFT_480184 [Eremomyces bilateralis CBS 781.70]
MKRALVYLGHPPMGPRKKSKGTDQAPAGSSTTTVDKSKDDVSNKADSTAAASSEQLDNPEARVKEPALSRSLPAGENGSTISRNGTTKPKEPKVKPQRSWYGGSWRSKARPVTEVARETVSSSPNTPPAQTRRSTATQPPPKSPRQYMEGSPRKTSKGDVVAASMTKLNITSNKSGDPSPPRDGNVEDVPREIEPPLPPDPTQDPTQSERTGRTSDETQKPKSTSQSTKGPTSTSWYGWWSRPDADSGDTAPQTLAAKSAETSLEDSKKTPLPGPTADEERKLDPAAQAEPNGGAEEEAKSAAAHNQSKGVNTSAPSKSWFGLWSNAQNAKLSPPAEADEPPLESVPEGGDKDLPDAPPAEVPPPQDSKQESAQSSGWAFWSRQTPQPEGKENMNGKHKQVGELAVADTPSQSHPEAAQFNEQEEPATTPPKSTAKTLRSKRGPKDDASKGTPASATASGKQQGAVRDNLLLPHFSGTYHATPPPSYWQQIRQFFLGDGLIPPHVHINPNPPHIKKALAIGVHGWFPAAFLNGVIGQPTGTSIRFANHAAAAIERWVDARGYTCDIEKVALEGEGMVSDRVATLWNLLLNWIEHIKSADFILLACHSQGVPVGIMLISKLIQFGCIHPNARIGICAMAGVNLGPFPEYKSRILGGAAFELFEFTRNDSKMSKAYREALEVVVKAGVRVVYIGSIDDQLVSLESSTFSNIAHPYIFRAVFVDGRIHAPDFLTRLVGFVLKLRNLGIPDHGLIRELSPALAGSLYMGEGHSRIYDEGEVYFLSVQCALETTNLASISAGALSGLSPARLAPKVKEEKPIVAIGEAPRAVVEIYEANLTSTTTTSGVTGGFTTQNPYFLPWAMRGLLEEEFVRKELRAEVQELLELFESWKPTTKQLKDVKFRLEVVRSKL